MRKRESLRKRLKPTGWEIFEAEAAYAQSIFRGALGDQAGSLAALERTLQLNPSYSPAILSMGSVKYQLGQNRKGRELFHSLVSLPMETPELAEILDEAGSFLIEIEAYKDGLELFREAAGKFPCVAALHQGLACCAGHQSLHDEAVSASQRALELEPDNQEHVNDLGWSLFEAGRVKEAEQVLRRAVTMDPSDDLARENLRVCGEQISRSSQETTTAGHRARRTRSRPQPR